MIQAKKTLGQNFMKNKKVLEKMVEAGKISDEDVVVEIGPGKGALTEKILKNEKVKKLIAIEKDHRLISFLKEKFQKEIDEKRFELIEADALKIDYEKLGLVNHGFIVIANLPYYITGKFLSSTLSNGIQPKNMVLLLQKEIVERIVGLEIKNKKKKQLKKENILSLSVKIFGRPEYIMSVSRKNFSPEPKVDSAILGIYDISKNFFLNNKILEKDFFDFVKLIFRNKRKTLMRNLKQNLKNNDKQKKNEEMIFELKNMKLDLKVRAEDLSLDEIEKLFLVFQKINK